VGCNTTGQTDGGGCGRMDWGCDAMQLHLAASRIQFFHDDDSSSKVLSSHNSQSSGTAGNYPTTCLPTSSMVDLAGVLLLGNNRVLSMAARSPGLPHQDTCTHENRAHHLLLMLPAVKKHQEIKKRPCRAPMLLSVSKSPSHKLDTEP